MILDGGTRGNQSKNSRGFSPGIPDTGDANVKGRNTKRELFPAPKNSRYLKVSQGSMLDENSYENSTS